MVFRIIGSVRLNLSLLKLEGNDTNALGDIFKKKEKERK